MSLLAGYLNAKNPVWNCQVPNRSGKKQLEFFDWSDFHISAPHCPTYCILQGNGDILDSVLHSNVRMTSFSLIFSTQVTHTGSC